MIRGLGTTIVCACLAGAMGVGLFFVKHGVKEQEARLAELNREIQSNQEAIHVLKAEWSYLNDPARLRALSEKFLSMKVMGPTQIASLDTLPAAGSSMVAAARPLAPAPDPAPVAKPAQIPAKAPTAVAKAPAPAPAAPKPDTTPTAAAAPRPPLVPGADTTPRMAAAPLAPPQPRAPGQPGRAIVVQSPALASTPAPPGEVR